MFAFTVASSSQWAAMGSVVRAKTASSRSGSSSSMFPVLDPRKTLIPGVRERTSGELDAFCSSAKLSRVAPT